MFKKITIFTFCLMTSFSYAENEELINNAEELFNATQIVCSGISDEISKISNISKANTVVTAVGTVAAGGALVAGIKKSEEEEEIDALVAQICAAGGCSPEGIETMSDEYFFNNVFEPMGRIAELQERLKKSKDLGNWRTGLLAGTIGTNLASSIMSGLNSDQSDLIQHISACNEMVKKISNIEIEFRKAGVGPMHSPLVKKINTIQTWCTQIDIKDVEKIEKRMKGVMGTSIAGTAIGIVGVGTSAAANSDKYMTVENRLSLTEQEKQKKDALNTTANVMAGANIVTGGVETGLNISLITLTKKLIEQAKRCEEILE
jgi:hypothetical protein